MNYDPYEGGGGYALWIGLAVAIGLMLLRNRKPRPLNINLLWVRPLILLGIVTVAFAAAPPPISVLTVAVLGLGLVAGAGLGWQRARFTRIEVHPETHALTTRVSPLGLVFLVGLILLRNLMRGAAAQARSAHVPLVAVTDGLVLFGGALIIAGSLEIWLRSRKLLAEARAAHSNATVVSGDDHA